MVCFVSLDIFLACFSSCIQYIFIKFVLGGFLGMILFIFVQNIVFQVIPHFRGNSATQKIHVFDVTLTISQHYDIGLFQKFDTHPLEKTWEPQRIYSHFSLGIPPKISTFLVARLKKTWEFPNFLIILSTKNGNSQFFTVCDIKKEFPFFKTIFRIPIFVRSKFEPENSQIFKWQYACLLQGGASSFWNSPLA